jgi:hypothetical protein
MKIIVRSIILVCLILGGCNDQHQSNKSESDLQSNYANIDITTPSGWSLTIKQDGSGQVGFGSHAVDYAGFEKNTFHFPDIIQKLGSKLESEGSISSKIAVSLWKEGDTSVNAKYISDKELVSKYFQKALSAITFNKERIEKIYKEKQPVTF